MKNKLLMAVSVAALLSAAPVFGQTSAQAQTSTSTQTGNIESNIEQGWENTKEAASRAAEGVENISRNAYQNIKSHFTSDKDNLSQAEYVNPRQTAKGIIGQPVYNREGEQIAEVEDIIIDGDGKAQLIVLSSGNFGVGKKVAFKYDSVVRTLDNGALNLAIDKEAIASAPEFRFRRDRGVNEPGVTAMNLISVSSLLDGELLANNGDVVGDVDNITFRDGKAQSVIVSYGDILGVGGEKVALNFPDASMVRQGSDVDFRLNASQTAQFQSYVGSETRYR